jgi:hypothetical protein
MKWLSARILLKFRFSGMISAIKLENQFNLDNLEIFEMNKELGGTWWSNSYPGSECDIPIHGYCITFEPRAGLFQMNYSFTMHNPFTLLFTLLSLSVRLEQTICKARGDTQLYARAC